MPSIAPIKRKDFIYYLRQLGFDGPYSGGKHEYMVKGQTRLTLPNPHRDIDPQLLLRILKQSGITWQEWEEL